MAEKKKAATTAPVDLLPSDTEIEVFGIKGDRIIKKRMTFGAAKLMKRKPGWVYVNYQIGFSSMQPTE